MTISQLDTVGNFGVARGESFMDRDVGRLWPIPGKLGAIATLNSLGR